MKNKLSDLNNHLFMQLERLNNEELTLEQLELEISRSKAVADVASQVVESARVSVDAMKIFEKAGVDISPSNKVLLLG